jgi:murein DD-endopeptidase MepM/ murein hydrolase activator NlpD
VLNHGYGYKTVYAHMSKILVNEGEKVKRGQVIGLVGSTGLSVAPHVHYEVRKNDKPINPINFYSDDITPLQYNEIINMSKEQGGQSLD